MSHQKEFFDPATVTQDTPRLAWLKLHRIKTLEWQEPEDEDERWCCWSLNDCEFPECDEDATHAATEHNAIAQWAIEAHVRLWNEKSIDLKRDPV